jgi:pyroglutamyl-peptidase
MADVLLTGFEAYGHTPINPAEQVARALDGTRINDATIVARVIPNIFFKAIEVVRAAIEEIHPEIVVMLGEYGGRAVITVERIAHNLNDSTRYRLADNDIFHPCRFEPFSSTPPTLRMQYFPAPRYKDFSDPVIR